MKGKIGAEVERVLQEDYQKYYRLAFSYVKNQHDALDIVQESAYKAIKDCGKIKEPDYLGTWIYRIVVNTAIDFLRKRKKESCSLDQVELVYQDTYQENDWMEMLSHLEEKERAVIVLRYFEDMKLEEISRVLGENVNTVKARLYRTLKKLRLDLELEMAN